VTAPSRAPGRAPRPLRGARARPNAATARAAVAAMAGIEARHHEQRSRRVQSSLQTWVIRHGVPCSFVSRDTTNPRATSNSARSRIGHWHRHDLQSPNSTERLSVVDSRLVRTGRSHLFKEVLL
jgi:hypothetical protein